MGEEIICGDRHDPSNALKWDSILLNLPGNMDYDPTYSWVYKHDMSTGQVANDFGTYVDNVQMGSKAHHANSVHLFRIKEHGLERCLSCWWAPGHLCQPLKRNGIVQPPWVPGPYGTHLPHVCPLPQGHSFNPASLSGRLRCRWVEAHRQGIEKHGGK
eukprot:13310256-Ditylum_brightwellii.AAC.1